MWISELLQYAEVAGFDINQHLTLQKALSTYGKTLQDIIYKNNGFDNLKLRIVTGVNQTEHATAGINLRKNIITANKVQYKSWDLAVSYINLDPRYDGRNKKERILVFGK